SRATAVASKPNLSSLPPGSSIENGITHVPLKCISPEVIDLVLPQTWSKDLKQSEKKDEISKLCHKDGVLCLESHRLPLEI
uniref:Prolactin receptor n=1 Tax=Romanomermis culicivorax TaxID=13658 RepID=A0A915J920_ROMCU